MDEAFRGLDDFRRIVDDVVVFDSDLEKHMQHIRQILCRCEEKISLNHEKFQFCQRRAHSAGYTLTPLGYSINNDVTEAIAQFPTPSSQIDLCSFFGLVNQLASSTKNIAELMAPLRPLLSTHKEFLWAQLHDEAFALAKKALTTPPTVAYFHTMKETRLTPV